MLYYGNQLFEICFMKRYLWGMKKKRLFIFNSDCELAIADGGRFYMPPANIRCMMRDLAFLPAYLGNEGDYVLVEEMLPEGFGEGLGVECRAVAWGEGLAGMDLQGEPWGRSPKMCHWLAERGWGEEWKEGGKNGIAV